MEQKYLFLKSNQLLISFLIYCFSFSLMASEIEILAAPTDIGNSASSITHDMSFELAAIPENPTVEVSFKVKTAGSCPKSYESTTFFMNGDNFAELDFRDFKEGENLSFALKPDVESLKVGSNKLRIITGECSLGVDSMSMNSIRLN